MMLAIETQSQLPSSPKIDSITPMSVVESSRDKMVCYCYGLRESDIVQSMQLHGCQELSAIMTCSGAGTGCTACHRRIQDVIDQQAIKACHMEASRGNAPPLLS